MMKMRPFFQTLQQIPQTIYKQFSTRHLPPSNQLWLEARAASLTWEPVLTLEQEASYADESWVNSTPHISDLDTVAEMPAINVQKVLSHILDAPDQFAAISNQLLTPEVKDKTLIPRIPTAALPKPQITDKLRLGNITDPFLPSVGMTPHELAIVPRRATTQLPPHMRLHENHSDSQEDRISVETLVNAAILEFHEQHHRLPHKIIIAAIRYWRYKISLTTFNPEIFYYKDAPIPITYAPIGEFSINEVRLD